jgi:hypothetical protein
MRGGVRRVCVRVGGDARVTAEKPVSWLVGSLVGWSVDW